MILFLLNLALLVLAIVSLFCGDSVWWLSIFNTFHYYILLVVLVLSWLSFLFDPERYRFVVFLLNTILFISLYTPLLSAERWSEGPEGGYRSKRLRIASIDLNQIEDNSYPEIYRLLHSYRPDIVCIQGKEGRPHRLNVSNYRSHQYKNLQTVSKYSLEFVDQVNVHAGLAQITKIRYAGQVFYVVNVYGPELDILKLGDMYYLQEIASQNTELIDEVIAKLQSYFIDTEKEKVIIMSRMYTNPLSDVYSRVRRYGFVDSYALQRFTIPLQSFDYPQKISLGIKEVKAIPLFRSQRAFVSKGTLSVSQPRLLKNLHASVVDVSAS